MKKLFYILSFLIPMFAIGQSDQGTPTTYIRYKGGIKVDSVLVAPVGKTSTSQNGMPFKGRIRINSLTNKFEYHNGTSWVTPENAISGVTLETATTNGNTTTNNIKLQNEAYLEVQGATPETMNAKLRWVDGFGITSTTEEFLFNDKNVVRSVGGVEADMNGDVPIDAIVDGLTGDFVPITGTTEGNAVTGDIEFHVDDTQELRKYFNTNIGSYIQFPDEASLIIGSESGEDTSGGIRFTQGVVQIETRPNTLGLISAFDYSANNDGTDRKIYPQTGWVKDYVADAIAGVGGTLQSVLNNGSEYEGDAEIFISPESFTVISNSNASLQANSNVSISSTVGDVAVSGNGSNSALLKTELLTSNRNFQFPDKSGTFALLSDIDNYDRRIHLDLDTYSSTATTSEQVLKTFSIATAYQDKGLLRFYAKIAKAGTNAACTFKIYKSASSTFSVGTATLLATAQLASAQLSSSFWRDILIKSASSWEVWNTFNQVSTESGAGAVAYSTVSNDNTVTQYIHITATLGNTGDTVSVRFVELTYAKQ